jgi:hypothetical protein
MLQILLVLFGLILYLLIATVMESDLTNTGMYLMLQDEQFYYEQVILQLAAEQQALTPEQERLIGGIFGDQASKIMYHIDYYAETADSSCEKIHYLHSQLDRMSQSLD